MCFFFLKKKKKLGFTPCKAEQPLQGMELQEREAQKILKHTGNLFRKNLQLKDVNSRLKGCVRYIFASLFFKSKRKLL